MELLKKKLTIATIVYWFLLMYIVAALVWWFIELENQNRQMTNYKINELKKDDPAFTTKRISIEKEKDRKTAQYLGEGITFLALILLGAVFIYRAVRRQFRLQQVQQNFMMAVTHELKTPIAIAKLNLETLQKHQLDEAKKQKLIAMTLQETNRLNTLASNILISSQLEGGKYHVEKEELDFSHLLRNSIDEFIHRYPERNFNVEIEPEVDVEGDALLLQILVNNLLENAVKYSPRESAIHCTLKKLQNRVVLNIADEGPGISAAEKKKIFDMFYRIGSEETRKAKGTGLGLYLCKKIAKDHHAIIQVKDNHPTGSIFTVSFPSND